MSYERMPENKSKTRRIGLLGGTFNPIHLGHLAMAQASLEKLKLNSVIFFPSYLPPHKSSRGVISATKRLAMTKLAVKGNVHFQVNEFEIRNKKKSYSIDTVKHLKSLYPKNTKFFFIIGEDMVSSLDKWRKSKELKKLVTFTVIDRPCVKRLRANQGIKTISMPNFGISSSYIREEIRAGRSVKYVVPDAVNRYINRLKLYS